MLIPIGDDNRDRRIIKSCIQHFHIRSKPAASLSWRFRCYFRCIRWLCVLFPTRGVHVWIFIFIVTIPAFLVVGIWFVFQVLNGLGTLGGEEAGGVAYAAHIGGFIFGLMLVKRYVKRVPLSSRRSSWSIFRDY